MKIIRRYRSIVGLLGSICFLLDTCSQELNMRAVNIIVDYSPSTFHCLGSGKEDVEIGLSGLVLLEQQSWSERRIGN